MRVPKSLGTLPTVVAVAIGAVAHAAPGYSEIARIAGPDGGYDYVSVDSAARRLFVAREYGVMAVDLATGNVTPTLVAGDNVSAVLIIPGTELMLSTNWGGNTATIFDRRTGAIKAEIPAGKEPDSAAFDPVTRRVFVMNGGSNDVTVIDVDRAAVLATIPLAGKPEAAVADGAGRLYVNIEDTAEIAVIDLATLEVTGHHALPGCTEPTGLAYDARSGLLIAACHNRTVKLVEAATGLDRGTVAVGEGADGAIFDPQRRRAIIPCSDGTLSILNLDAQGGPLVFDVVRTHEGARTAALDPQSGRIYLPTADFTTDGSGERVQVAGTFRVLVVAPR